MCLVFSNILIMALNILVNLSCHYDSNNLRYIGLTVVLKNTSTCLRIKGLAPKSGI